MTIQSTENAESTNTAQDLSSHDNKQLPYRSVFEQDNENRADPGVLRCGWPQTLLWIGEQKGQFHLKQKNILLSLIE